MRVRVACMFLALVFAPTATIGQTRSLISNLANPAIGLNGLFTGQAAPDLDEPYGLQFDAAEISFNSVVDQNWTLWANIAFTPEEVDPEEVYAVTSAIPNVQVKLGQLRATFGKQGLLHTHAFPFIQAPVIMSNTIGDEGFKDTGIEAAWLTPIPWFCELTGGIYTAISADEEHPLDFGSSDHGNIPLLGNLKNQIDLSDNTTLEAGASALTGKGEDGFRHAAYGASVTVRNVPARQANRRGWTLQSEYLQQATYADGNYDKGADGWYAYLQYRWSQMWWSGLRVEEAVHSRTDVLTDPSTGEPIPGRVKRACIQLAWTPSEFSYIRAEYSHAKADGGNGNEPLDRRFMIQLSFTIGFHPPHAY